MIGPQLSPPDPKNDPKKQKMRGGPQGNLHIISSVAQTCRSILVLSIFLQTWRLKEAPDENLSLQLNTLTPQTWSKLSLILCLACGMPALWSLDYNFLKPYNTFYLLKKKNFDQLTSAWVSRLNLSIYWKEDFWSTDQSCKKLLATEKKYFWSTDLIKWNLIFWPEIWSSDPLSITW